MSRNKERKTRSGAERAKRAQYPSSSDLPSQRRSNRLMRMALSNTAHSPENLHTTSATETRLIVSQLFMMLLAPAWSYRKLQYGRRPFFALRIKTNGASDPVHDESY